MAVFTHLEETHVVPLLAQYDIGELVALHGIAEGVENSNFMLITTTGRYILTLFEQRTNPEDLPYFMDLMGHLAANGIACPEPIANIEGQVLQMLRDRPAVIISFLPGLGARRPTINHCALLGKFLANFHQAGEDFSQQRPTAMGLPAWQELLSSCLPNASETTARFIEQELTLANNTMAGDNLANLPTGTIHADLFPDNLFFLNDHISGVIDFYFACTDVLLWDVAVCLNAWCFERDHSFNYSKSRRFLEEYQQVRPFTAEEKQLLPGLARAAALRFYATRLYDWYFTPADSLVRRKDPEEYAAKLRFHATVTTSKDYGLS